MAAPCVFRPARDGRHEPRQSICIVATRIRDLRPSWRKTEETGCRRDRAEIPGQYRCTRISTKSAPADRSFDRNDVVAISGLADGLNRVVQEIEKGLLDLQNVHHDGGRSLAKTARALTWIRSSAGWHKASVSLIMRSTPHGPDYCGQVGPVPAGFGPLPAARSTCATAFFAVSAIVAVSVFPEHIASSTNRV